MQLVDHLFVLLLFIVQPVLGAYEFRRFIRRVEAGEPADRIRLYRQTIWVEWLALAVLGGAWHLLGRPFADLGFVRPAGSGFWIGAAFVALVSAYLAFAWWQTRSMSPDKKAEHRDSLGDLRHFLPHDEREFSSFTRVSITAGIAEEIIYRGFVLWYLLQLMPAWVAVVVSSVIFGLGHSYQGNRGIARVTLVGAVFAGLFFLTGSIWVPIAGHILLDVLQGGIIVNILGGKAKAAHQAANTPSAQ
jgi:membrane protease YdiL (CAAX protease family)